MGRSLDSKSGLAGFDTLGTCFKPSIQPRLRQTGSLVVDVEAEVAQLVERGSETPEAIGSTPIFGNMELLGNWLAHRAVNPSP